LQAKLCLVALAAVVAITAGCGGGGHSQMADLSSDPNSCGRHDFPNGNAGEVAALARTSCTQALQVANQYFSTGHADRPWFCTKLPGKRSDTTECFVGHYGVPAQNELKAQSQPAPIFLIRP
jgi:hypothetical protein